MGLWYWIAEEFRALGLRCVAFGPEFWLGVAAISCLMCISVAVCCFVFRGNDKRDRH